MATFSPAGDSGILVTFGETIDPLVNRRVHALAARISDLGIRISDFSPQAPEAAEAATASPEHPQSDIRNPKFFTVPGYATLLVRYNPLAMDYAQALELVRREAERVALAPLPEPRRVEVPVYYGGEHGPDLEDVARHCGLTPAEVVRLHAAGEYPVYLIGFTPGFPYLGGMDPRLATPRLVTPRPRVPAGSVGIAGPQTGIYSIDSPGGWRIIGWTPLRLFDPAADPPALLRPGDVVVFRQVSCYLG